MARVKEQPGARAGKAIAGVVADTLRAHHEHATPHTIAARDAWLRSFMEGMEQEFAAHNGPLWEKLAGDDAAPEWVQKLAKTIITPTKQHQTFLEVIAAIPGIFSLANAVLVTSIVHFQQMEFHKDQNVELSPADWALSVVRGETPHDEAAGHATYSGIDGYKFTKLVNNVGEPLSLQDLLFLKRRGHIDDARLDHGIRQSRIRNEWIDAAHALEFIPMSAQEAVMSVLKGHLSHDEGRKVFTDNGIEAKWFDVLVATAGRPVGIGEALELLRRDEIDDARVEQIVRQSDVNNAFMPEVLKLRYTRPPPRSVPALLHSGSITEAEALRLLKDAGYPDHLAQAVVHNAGHTKSAGARLLSMATVHQLYAQHLVDKAKATAMLKADKFDDASVGELLALWDHERVMQRQAAGIAGIRARYLQRHTDRPGASAALDRIGVDRADRDDLIRIWDVELEAGARQLTEAQVLVAWGIERIDTADCTKRLEGLGLSQADVEIIMDTFQATSRNYRRRAR